VGLGRYKLNALLRVGEREMSLFQWIDLYSKDALAVCGARVMPPSIVP
jgi:hypothetical protein